MEMSRGCIDNVRSHIMILHCKHRAIIIIPNPLGGGGGAGRDVGGLPAGAEGGGRRDGLGPAAGIGSDGAPGPPFGENNNKPKQDC